MRFLFLHSGRRDREIEMSQSVEDAVDSPLNAAAPAAPAAEDVDAVATVEAAAAVAESREE